MGCQSVRCNIDLEVANIPRSGKDASSQLQTLAAGAEKNRNELLLSPPCGSKMPRRARKAIVLAKGNGDSSSAKRRSRTTGDDDAPDNCHLQQQSQGHERFKLASCILSILAKKVPSLQVGCLVLLG